jgi:hydroxymethylpyrimidine pyrophosphatase-like HAD family hydrolase
MRYSVLASDYDGTLAKDGVVAPDTLDALERVRNSGRRVIMVTGRELPDLGTVFPRFDLFDCIIAENGALLYWPRAGTQQVLGAPPSTVFVETLQQRGVAPLSVGEVIVATLALHKDTVREAIRELELELDVILNKNSLMVLPSGINKVSGLRAALDELGISEHSVVGVGDAENDRDFLGYCALSAAVANALPSVKGVADITTQGTHGAGVIELIDMMLNGRIVTRCGSVAS